MHIFSGIYKNRTLQAPKGLCTRPTSGRLRETLFNICQHYVGGCRFLDLFAGSGAMGLEALSRGAIEATFIDNSKESIRCINKNVQVLQEEKHAKVIFGDVFEQLDKIAKKGWQYDIIFADPPYENVYRGFEHPLFYSAGLLKLIDNQLKNQVSLLAPQGVVFIEEAAEISFEDLELSHLKLKNSRHAGGSALHCFVKL